MLIVIVIVAVLVWYLVQPHFLAQPEFIDVTEQSPYFRRMSAVDLCARSIDVAHADCESYLAWYQANILEWRWSERAWMTAVALEAERRMRRHLAHMIPTWRFAKVTRSVEMGHPHTLADVIVWSDDTIDRPFLDQVELAIHEAIHIWQRRHPDRAIAYHKKMGYHVVNIAPDVRLRNNPDSDQYVWQPVDEAVSLGRCYRSDRPSDLNDVHGIDHPNEQQAYALAALAMS